jgi:hypothetical protein
VLTQPPLILAHNIKFGYEKTQPLPATSDCGTPPFCYLYFDFLTWRLGAVNTVDARLSVVGIAILVGHVEVTCCSPTSIVLASAIVDHLEEQLLLRVTSESLKNAITRLCVPSRFDSLCFSVCLRVLPRPYPDKCLGAHMAWANR